MFFLNEYNVMSPKTVWNCPRSTLALVATNELSKVVLVSASVAASLHPPSSAWLSVYVTACDSQAILLIHDLVACYACACIS